MNEKKHLKGRFAYHEYTHNNKKNVGEEKQRTSLRKNKTLVRNIKNNVVFKFLIQF